MSKVSCGKDLNLTVFCKHLFTCAVQNKKGHQKAFNFCQPAQKTSQVRRKEVLILVSKKSQIGLKWKSRQPFLNTLSRLLPGDVVKTPLRRLKTFSRPFLVKAKDHLENTHRLCIYIRFKLDTSPLHHQTKCINLNKL